MGGGGGGRGGGGNHRGRRGGGVQHNSAAREISPLTRLEGGNRFTVFNPRDWKRQTFRQGSSFIGRRRK